MAPACLRGEAQYLHREQWPQSQPQKLPVRTCQWTPFYRHAGAAQSCAVLRQTLPVHAKLYKPPGKKVIYHTSLTVMPFVSSSPRTVLYFYEAMP